MHNLSLLLLVFLLSGCGDSISVKPAVAPCKTPLELPERALSDQEIELYWGRDRASLRTCGLRLEALISK